MYAPDILTISTKASNLALLAVAVTEYEQQAPAAFPNIDPFTMKQGLAVLLNDCMKQLRGEIKQADLPGTFYHALSAACGGTAALADMAIEAEGDEAAYDDFCSLSYIVADAVARLAVELDEIA